MVAQAHGGALQPGGTPEGSSKGGLVAAERRRALAARNEELDEAIIGHRENLLGILGEVLEDARGEQYRCPCGLFGPKQSKFSLNEIVDAVMKLEKGKGLAGATVVVPFQITVVGGAQVEPNLPAEVSE